MKTNFALLLYIIVGTLNAQLYFPPNGSNSWETLTFAEANYKSEAYQPLVDFLSESKSKGFVLLKGGKIVIEEYFEGFSQEDNWYWASAGKTLTSSIVGIAQQDGFLDIQDYTSDYLGENWTNCPDDNIKIIHQLSMTSGLDYTVDNSFCTLPECLLCLNSPGTEWFYHNAVYTLLDKVIENATGKNYNTYTRNAITNKLGMNGFWLRTGDNNLYWSTPRSMARFGLMALAGGKWDGETIINEEYFNQMTNTSQEINESYGYLWWLNGKSSFRLPSTTFTFNGSITPKAPSDMYAGLGANGQICMVIPSLDMVLVRMGNDPENSPVPTTYVNDLWDKVQALLPTTSIIEDQTLSTSVFPNPISSSAFLTIQSNFTPDAIVLKCINGRVIKTFAGVQTIQIPELNSGVYLVEVVFLKDVISRIIIIE